MRARYIPQSSNSDFLLIQQLHATKEWCQFFFLKLCILNFKEMELYKIFMPCTSCLRHGYKLHMLCFFVAFSVDKTQALFYIFVYACRRVFQLKGSVTVLFPLYALGRAGSFSRKSPGDQTKHREKRARFEMWRVNCGNWFFIFICD